MEAEIKKILFETRVAEKREEEYRNSLMKGEEHRRQIEVQRSVKAGVREFLQSRQPLGWNLGMCMVIWAVIIMNY